MSLDTQRATLEDLSDYFLVTSLWPAVLYTFVLMVIGILGNALVLLVYRRHFRRSVTRMFIFTLAALDLGSCVITMPSELLILFRFASFPSSGWCKASRFLTYTFNGSSSLILIAIAMDRYFKVCRPYQKCVTIPIAQKICICVVSITAVLSIPSLILYGDAKFPVLVKDGHAQILPLDLKNATWMPEGWHIKKGTFKYGDIEAKSNRMSESGTPDGGYIFFNPLPDSSAAISSVNVDNSVSQAKTNTDTAKVETGQVSKVSVIHGHFCLISSEDSGSPLAVLFYCYMFLFWLLLLVLVVYFYSRVAHAMFLLRNIHDKMFSMGDRDAGDNYNNCSLTRRSCTPRTTSLAKENDQYEYDVQYHHQIGLKSKGQGQIPTEGVVLLSHGVRKSSGIEKQDGGRCIQGGDVSSNTDLQTNNEERLEAKHQEEYSILAAEPKDADDDVIGTGNTSQCVSQKSLSSMKSEKLSHLHIHEASKTKLAHVSADSVYETGSLDTSSCVNLPQSNKECQEMNVETAGAPRSKSMEDVVKANKNEPNSVPIKRKSFILRKLSSKRKSGKVPKIKVSQIKEKSKSNDLVSDSKQERMSFLPPAITNNLFVRRIKSMENVNSFPKLDCLQVPSKGSGRHHGSLNLKTSPEKVEQKEAEPKTNSNCKETVAVIGTLTNSSTSLQYTTPAPASDESSDVKQVGEKTLTLTRSSAKGKRNVCVLPLTGLTTKAAIQNQESEEKRRIESKQKAAILPNSYASVLAAQLDGPHLQRRGSGIDTLEHPPSDETVQFRQKDKMSGSSGRKSVDILEIPGKQSNSQAEMKNGGQGVPTKNNIRRARPSTADILSERHRRGTLHPVRTSRMLFFISLVFLISFLPFFIIVLMRSAIGSSSFLASLNGAGLGAVSVFIRSSLISNAVNPVIYGLMSTHFRRECTGLVRCFMRR